MYSSERVYSSANRFFYNLEKRKSDFDFQFSISKKMKIEY